MKIRPVGAELFLADRRTDRHDEVSRRFSRFCACAQRRHRLLDELKLYLRSFIVAAGS